MVPFTILSDGSKYVQSCSSKMVSLIRTVLGKWEYTFYATDWVPVTLTISSIGYAAPELTKQKCKFTQEYATSKKKYKNRNVYDVKWIYYETMFHDESNDTYLVW